VKTWIGYIAAAVVVGICGVVWMTRGPGSSSTPGTPSTPSTPSTSTTPAQPAAGAIPVAAVSGAVKVPAPAAPQATPAKPAATQQSSDASKWLEGQTAMGTIATAMRAYYVEVGPKGRFPRSLDMIGLTPGDVDGKYFGPADYTITVESMDPLKFVVTCTAGSKPDAPKSPAKKTLDSNGNFAAE
jgi:hypothetical protein